MKNSEKEKLVKRISKEFDEHTQAINKTAPRGYIGMSSVGHPCVRKTFLSWRFAKYPAFPSRVLRLFSRGHQEEPRFVDLLRGAGYPTYEVDPSTGKQFETIQHNGHCRGHADGVCRIDDEWFLLEFKTASNAMWLKYQRTKNLRIVNEEYYVQCQEYMVAFQLNKCLFMSVNKDNDSIYMEVIEKDLDQHYETQDKIRYLVAAKEVPVRIATSDDFWKCSYCDYKAICFYKETPNRNCRLCIHVKPVKKGQWYCALAEENLGIERQHNSCTEYKQIDLF